jgi:hypothetical protein
MSHYIVKIYEFESEHQMCCGNPSCSTPVAEQQHSYQILARDKSFVLCENCAEEAVSGALSSGTLTKETPI